MIEITHKDTGDVLRKVDADTLKGADLNGASLYGADLRGASLYGATIADEQIQSFMDAIGVEVMQ